MPILCFTEWAAETESNMVSFIKSIKHAAVKGIDIYNLFQQLVHEHKMLAVNNNAFRPELRQTTTKWLLIPTFAV